MQSTEAEVWKPVPHYEGSYEVSSEGRVRSLPRTYLRHGAQVRVPGRMLRLHRRSDGYLSVRLSDHGKSQAFQVHRLVATAFIGPGGPAEEVCHGDGIRNHNQVTNLRWGTRADNMQDAIAHGTNRNARKDVCDRGHEFTPENTRYAREGQMRICIACRHRKVPCPVCGEDRSYHGMKSHLSWAHRIEVEGRSWQKAFPSILAS